MAKPFTLRALEPTESQVLFSILQALELQKKLGKVVWFERMNTGAMVKEDKNGRRFIKFGFPGCPDIMGMLPGGRSLYLEAKRPSGYVRASQNAFINLTKKAGAAAAIVRSVDDALAVIDEANKQYCERQKKAQ